MDGVGCGPSRWIWLAFVRRIDALPSDDLRRNHRGLGVADTEAVAAGLERTGRLTTAASLRLAVAIGAFATSKVVFLKDVGIGTEAAVLIGYVHRSGAAPFRR